MHKIKYLPLHNEKYVEIVIEFLKELIYDIVLYVLYINALNNKI